MRSLPESMPVVGLVGGIGSGKSTVARCFALHCWAVVDADRIGHALLEEPEVIDEVHRRWGQGVFDRFGNVDRARLGVIVFADRQERVALNALLHPRIRRAMERRIDTCRRQRRRGVALDAAVLFEAGWDDLCTHTVFVHAPWPDRLRRVRDHRGWSARKLRQRQRSQFPLDKKVDLCCHGLRNHSDMSHLRAEVDRLIRRIAAS